MKISTPKIEGHFQAAKWIKIQALVEADELSELMRALDPFMIFPLAGILPLESFPCPQETFLDAYRGWLDALKRGEPPTGFGPLNASMWTRSSDALWLHELPGKRYVAKPKEPFLQVQIHHMGFSHVDKVFRPMSLTQDSLFWGLQFSFPQVFEDPEKGILETHDFPNAKLFQIVRKWSRDFTVATPMLVDGVRDNLPIRLGKGCFPWINSHPGFASKGISVLEVR